MRWGQGSRYELEDPLVSSDTELHRDRLGSKHQALNTCSSAAYWRALCPFLHCNAPDYQATIQPMDVAAQVGPHRPDLVIGACFALPPSPFAAAKRNGGAQESPPVGTGHALRCTHGVHNSLERAC